MQRGNTILLVGIIILVVSIIIFGLSAYKVILMIEKFPDISAKGIAVKVSDKLVDKVTERFNVFMNTADEPENDTTQKAREKLMIDAGIVFFAIISGIVLLINGLLAIIIGIAVWVHDRRHV